MISGTYQPPDTTTKHSTQGIQARRDTSNSNSGTFSSPIAAAMLPSVWTSLGTTCMMDTAGGLTASLSPPLTQASGFATPWPLAASEPCPQGLLFSYPQQAVACSVSLQSLANVLPVASSACSERPESRTDPSLAPMFSPFDPPMSLSPSMLTSEPNTSSPATQQHMPGDLFTQVCKHRAPGPSWQEISDQLPLSSYPGAPTICDAAHLAQTFDAKLAGINQNAAVAAAAAAAAAATMQPLPLSLTTPLAPQRQPRLSSGMAAKRATASRPASSKRSVSASASSPAAPTPSRASKRALADEKEHQTYINIDQFFELQRLIRMHGEDWNKLGQLMDMRGSDLSSCWNGYTVDSKVTREWTSGEMDILGLCRELGIPCRLSSKIIGTKLPLQCRRKILKKERIDVHAVYEHLYPGQTPPSEPVVWSTGHVDVLHKTRAPASCSQSSLVTKCVEETVANGQQLSSGDMPEIDWPAVSMRTGLAVKQCLELNRFSGSKASWVYSADSFEWGRAERMRQFIVANYPAPTPIDFVAVSNYLWTDMTDCISMYGLLCGRFEWTQEALATISELVAVGWTDERIARHLSPVMTGTRIAHTRLMFHAQAQAFASVHGRPQIPADMDASGMATIRHLVDLYAEDRAVDIIQLLDRIRASLPAHDRTTVDKCALITISGHPTCVTKMIRRAHRKPKAKAASSAGKSSAAAAAAFDDPAFYSAKWTDKEIDMLVQYAKTNGPERNWRHFANIIGTKTPSQCSNKYRSLRRYQKIKI
ncbi:hypothetical protein IWW45_001045 [Coemansia sp. RSA 485]|nr:hypothetical protein IWW45_001045 [Coemansia sp. RSA 485]